MPNQKINLLKKNTTVIIFCGGKGLRLRPLTFNTPKPLIKINNISILEHLINQFLKYQINNIIIATGYKNQLFKEFLKKKYKNKNIKIINSRINSDIIYRLNKSLKFSKENIIACYGDTLLNLNINKLINEYSKNSTKIIMTNYELKSAFGIVKINKNLDIVDFIEKPNLNIWYNVGYFMFNKKFETVTKKYKTFKNFLKHMAISKNIKSFKHYGQHITINTISELEEARQKIRNF
jgi:NDP-sugar pyrophosphorylase family protein